MRILLSNMGKQSYGRRDLKENVTVDRRVDQGEVCSIMHLRDRLKYV